MYIIKLLIGGSPCTYWSIAQSKNRETEAEGQGWELFKNFLIAKEKYKPDYFLYENNKSMASQIKEQITQELGVEPIMINSSLVSAQNRQRYYWTNIPGIQQPEDRGIILRDILESGKDVNEKTYLLNTNISGVELINVNPSGRGMNGAVMHVEGKSRCLTTNKGEGQKIIEQIRVGTLPNEDGEVKNSQSKRIYSVDGKSVPLCAASSAGGCSDTSSSRTGLYAEPVIFQVPHGFNKGGFKYDKSPTLTANGDWAHNNFITESVRIGTIENNAKNQKHDSKQYRVYFPDGKSTTICGEGGGVGAKTGLYACPISEFEEANYEVINGATVYVTDTKIRQGDDRGSKQGKYVYLSDAKTNSITAGQAHNEKVLVPVLKGEWKNIYKVENGIIEIKGKSYPIKLQDGFYIIRKLTITECKRLQTVPDIYIMPCSNTQNYRMLGNGWTVDVIAHILSYIPNIQNEQVEVLSMYDGMSCGHIALDKLGANIERYYATEIDKYAIQTTMTNFPDTIQLGDAFQVRDSDWCIEKYIA